MGSVWPTLVVPNLLVFCALGFSVAALTRTAVLSFAASLVLIVLALVINTQTGPDAPEWLYLLDPFGGFAVGQAIRYWSVSELNTLLPVTFLPENRLLWLGVAASATGTDVLALPALELAFASKPSFPAARRLRASSAKPPSTKNRHGTRSFRPRDTLSQLLSHLRMDLRAVLCKAPLLDHRRHCS